MLWITTSYSKTYKNNNGIIDTTSKYIQNSSNQSNPIIYINKNGKTYSSIKNKNQYQLQNIKNQQNKKLQPKHPKPTIHKLKKNNLQILKNNLNKNL